MKINSPVITLFFASIMMAVLNVAVADEGNQWHRENVVPYSLIHASAHGDFVEVKRLIETGANLDEINEGGWTALMAAANNGHAEVAKVLLEAGAKRDIADKKGRTAWHKAKANGHDEIVKVLLAKAKMELATEPATEPEVREGWKVKRENLDDVCDPNINWIRACRLACDGSVICSAETKHIVGSPCYCMEKRK